MTCYHPVAGVLTSDGVKFGSRALYDGRDIEVPCGQCIGCRLRRAQDWRTRCLHEAMLWPRNCFVTLTYRDEALPPGGGLVHADFQQFVKRWRRYRERRLLEAHSKRRVFPYLDGHVRYMMCGEYGEKKDRPHYHALCFNEDFRPWKWAGRSAGGYDYFTNAQLTKLWGKGIVTVQPLVGETAGYVAQYCLKKLTGPEGEAEYGERKPPYGAWSLKPGLGAAWYAKYGRKVSTQDFVVVDGREVPVPKYYDKLAERDLAVPLDEVKFQREVDAKARFADNTSERLAVREKVRKAQIATLERNL